MYKIFIAVLLLACSSQAVSQDSTGFSTRYSRSRAIGISSGLGRMVLREQVFTNFLYKADYAPLGFHYESVLPAKKFRFNLSFYNRPEFKTETNKGFEYKGDLGDFYPSTNEGYSLYSLKSYFYDFNFDQLFLLTKTSDRKIRTYLGYDFHTFRFQKDFLQFEYLNRLTDRIFSVGFDVHLERNFNERHQLTYTFSLPVINHVKRELYNPDSNPATVSDSRFTIFSSLFGLAGTFDYQYRISERFSLRASYAFRYMQITFPEKEQWAYNQLNGGIFFHF